MRTIILAILALLAALPASAQNKQTGPIPAGYKLLWDFDTSTANIKTVAQAQALEARLYLDTTPATALTSVTCAMTGTVITCQSVIGQSQRDAINQVGLHTLQLSAVDVAAGEGAKSLPLALTTRPDAPGNLRTGP